MRVIPGVKFTCYFVMNFQFVPFSQEINVGDSTRCRGGVSGFSSRKLIGCSILKAPENLFESNSTLNCQFVLFSSEIPLRRRGSRGRSPRKLVGFSVLKAQENPFPKVKFTKFRNEFSILYHLHQRFYASTNCKFLQVAHFPDCHQRKGGYSPPAPPPHLWARLCMGVIPF